MYVHFQQFLVSTMHFHDRYEKLGARLSDVGKTLAWDVPRRRVLNPYMQINPGSKAVTTMSL